MDNVEKGFVTVFVVGLLILFYFLFIRRVNFYATCYSADGGYIYSGEVYNQAGFYHEIETGEIIILPDNLCIFERRR